MSFPVVPGSQNESDGQNGVILFDGICNLCSRGINFVIDRDRRRYFRYAALQSDAGARYLHQLGMPDAVFKTIVLVEGDRYFTRSTAVLRIARKLSGAWPLLYLFIIIPPFIRNLIYDFIAKNRYKWFGKSESCRVPSPELSDLFLED